jgi:hypothetical protein
MERSLDSDVTHVNSVAQTADLVLFCTVRVNTISRDFPARLLDTVPCYRVASSLLILNLQKMKLGRCARRLD